MHKSFLFFILILSQFSSAINVRYIKDTYPILKPEYKHLSPVHGPVWWYKDIVENMYTYGGVKLTTYLFHPVQGSFNVTRAPGSAATYFTPRTVGRLLGEIEKVRPEIKRILKEKRKDAWKEGEILKVQEKLKKDLAIVLEGDKEYKAGVAGYLKTIQNDRAKLGYFLTNQRGVLAATVTLLAESGFFEIKGKESKTIYPFYTAYDILLTFLFRKAEDVKDGASVDKLDYKEYFEGLREKLGDFIFTQQGQESLASEAWLRDAYDDSEAAIIAYLQEIKSAIDKVDPLDMALLDQLYEKIVFAELSRPKGFPKLAQYRTTSYEGQLFSDCVDTTMRNLCNIVVFDVKTNTFNLAMIKDAYPSAECRAFYSNTLYQKATEIENPLVHAAWTSVVENRAYISYIRVLRVKDKKLFCCALRKHDSFNGFMLSSNALKRKAKGKIAISFADGSNETFDLLEMNGHRFALVDPEQFAPFEIMPSLKNIIILMNDLFGLQLYGNIETAFFEDNFNTTYFPLIKKKFDWEYTSSNNNLDESDYKEIEIKVKALGGLFILRLDLDIDLGFAHGQLILLSKTAHEQYQKSVFNFVCTQLVERAKSNQLDTYCFLTDLFALYQSQEHNALDSTIASFQGFDALKNFVYYTQQLQDQDVKLQVIKSITEGKDSLMYGACAALIRSLPVEGDLIYLKAISKMGFVKDVSAADLNPIAVALIDLYKSILARPIDKYTVETMMSFVDQGQAYDEAIQVATAAFRGSDRGAQLEAINLFDKLIAKDKGFDEAVDAANNNFNLFSEALMLRLNSKNRDLTSVATIMGIMAELAEKDKGPEVQLAVELAYKQRPALFKSILIARLDEKIYEQTKKKRADKLIKKIVGWYENSDDVGLKQLATDLKEKLKAKWVN